jgi:Kinesin motor domain
MLWLQVGVTAYNSQSSRSHTICRLLVQGEPVQHCNAVQLQAPATTRTSAWLTLVDLAGEQTGCCHQVLRLHAASRDTDVIVSGTLLLKIFTHRAVLLFAMRLCRLRVSSCLAFARPVGRVKGH